MRNQIDNNYFVSPIRSPGDFEESVHSDAKKSKNRHLAIINQLRRREDLWDGRFHLENIPNYKFNEDKHCETYKKMLIKKRGKKIVVKADSKIQTPSDIGFRRRNFEEQSTDSNYRRPETQEKSPIMDGRLKGINPRNIQSRDKSRGDSMRKYTPLIESLLREKKAQEERLAALWDRVNIPIFHRETFLKCENAQNLKQTIEIVRREADDIETNCSAIQLGIRAVTARENCLKQLKLLVNKLERSEAGSNSDLINEEDAKQKASELLTHLRILSLNAVETILKWREYIQQAYYITRGVVKANQTIIIPFIFNDTNYLIKMKNDIKSLTESSLARFFNFSSKSDPFLVYPSKETNGTDDKIVLYISKNLINRIRACELVILEESVHEHMSEKGTTPQTAGKANDSDRSVPKEEKAGQKQSNIRIRNVANKNDNKKLSAGPTSVPHKPTSDPKITTGSHSKIPESEHDASHKNQPMSEQPKQAASVDKISDHAISPEKDSPKKTQQEKSPERETIKSDYSQTFSPVKESPKKESPTKKGGDHALLVSPVKGATSEHVKPVDVYEDEIEGVVEEYLRDVDDKMKNSFLSDPKSLLERANMGQDPTWFKFINPEDGNKRVGLAVTHIDNTVFTSRRMVILHCTTVNRELYAEYLGKLVEYLWNSDECNEIKISLYHLEDANNNLGADKELSEAIKKLGFRWKQLTNDKFTGKRYIDYILKRPEGKVYQGQKFNDEPIHVESVVVLSDLHGADLNQSYEHKELVDNRFAILGAILKHCDEKVEQFAEGDSKRHKNYLSVITSLIKEEKAKIGEIVEKFQNLDEMVNFVGQKFENKDEFLPTIDQKHLTNKYTTSLLNLIYRWKSFNITHHKIAGKDREYLKINNNNDLVQFQSKYENSSIYFIPTDDNQVNIFLTDNQTLVNKIINKEEIIEDTVSKLFSKLDKNPTAFDKDLWVPMFSMHQRNVDLETAKELLKGEDKINFAKSTNVIGLNGNRVNGNLKVRPSEKSKIIEKAFLFGIVHEHVDFPLVSVVVQPEDFLEYNI